MTRLMFKLVAQQIIKSGLIILLVFPATLLQSKEILPQPFEASFKIFRNSVNVANAHLSLNHLSASDFIYRFEASLVDWISIFYKFQISEESLWHANKEYFQSLQYSYKETKKNKEKHEKIIFDWERNQAKSINNGTVLDLPLIQGMTDRLLCQINIMRDLSKGEYISSCTFLKGTKTKIYHFEYLTKETVETSLGQFDTVKIARKKAGKINAILWCADKLNYLPIKITKFDQQGNGKTTAMIDSFEWVE